MYQIISRYIDICKFKIAPQDIPYSKFLLLITLIAYFIGSVILSLFEWSLVKSVVVGLMDLSLIAGLSYMILWIRLSTERYVQTLTALAGSGAILDLVGIPIFLLQYNVDSGPFVLELVIWVWVFWNMAVFGHVLRHALSTTMFTGAMLSLLYFFISFSMLNTFFLSTMK
ncbi:MAG: hypothetical protein ACE5EH_05170 [Gammaproteobacteria bacterium]